ncbi:MULTISPECIES: fused response regulator/phosphatase [Pseudoalteromonas]|uniref:Fused response regulator/phosphatase n=1 Tax=Pseudoalteromonas amylolytica TaxID=1859457 RepID=A0A1S1MTS6_9GAMM|nr:MULTISPECIES: fused response regulator/phosphatase [Pseudoalteromonas]OHU87489.1 fused response regulator/phosphatase [Pseudoalteromonas sp. JW3]OHU90932.1 fused response regulator/phosphatase [Pseudoalteromonas amylolytica]
MRVLVVDDQPLNCILLKTMLEQQEYDVVVANDGAQAIELMKQCKVDVVLLDVLMPVMNGFEAAPKIKELAGDVYLPVIFITTLEDHESFEKCLAVGGDDFIHKPFDRVILSAKIRAHARTRRLSQEANQQKKQLEYHYNQIEREHEIVEHIFSNALDQSSKFHKYCDYHLSPASMFNGDMFLMAKSPMGGFYCLLGDFTGHGLAAAVGALPASRIFYAMVSKGMAVNDIAFELNGVLNTLLPSNMFCAAAIVELSESGKSVSAWLGGMPDLYLIDEQGDVVQTLESQHMALGILSDDEFERTTIHLEVKANQRLVMATDGIIETENKQGEMFGESRLKEALRSRHNISTEQVIQLVHSFSEHSAQQDDLSIAIINCLASEKAQQAPIVYSKIPFEFGVQIDAQCIVSTDPILELVDVLSKIEGVSEHRSNIFLLLSEAYNNAVDHGVLGLDSDIKNREDGFIEYYQLREKALTQLENALISIHVKYVPKDSLLEFIISDSGSGFRIKDSKDDNLQLEYGRGLRLLQEMSCDIQFNVQGNEVKIVYSLQ